MREVVLVKLLNLAKKGSQLKKNWGTTINVLKLQKEVNREQR